MFHATKDNKLYNFTKKTQTIVNLKSKKSEIELHAFLDDVSTWMDQHKNIIKNKYLPFSCLAVGLVPSCASAFLYGCFVGRAMEKKKIIVETEEGAINKKNMAKQIKDDIQDQMGWLNSMLKQVDKIEEDDNHDEI